MGEGTKIEWCQNSDGSPGYTFNPWRGCTRVSEACRFCYAERDRSVRLHGVKWGPTAERRISADSTWAQALAWDVKHRKAKTRGRVFCASLADVFEDRPELEAPRIRLLALIALTPSLDWLLLTKRPDVMAQVMNDFALHGRVVAAANVWRRAFPRRNLDAIAVHDPRDGWHNLWAGTTVENQRAADERIPHLLRVPARVRFLSCEPLLGPVELPCGATIDGEATDEITGIHWVIAGGESGPGARPSHPEWFRSLRDQCAQAGIPFFFKQWGDWAPTGRNVNPDGSPVTQGAAALHGGSWYLPDGAVLGRVGKHVAGRLLDGRAHDGAPS